MIKKQIPHLQLHFEKLHLEEYSFFCTATANITNHCKYKYII